MKAKSKKVVVFGILDTAEVAHYYLSHDSEYEVVAFTVNEQFIKEPFLRGLPVVPFEMVENMYKPDDFYFFVPMSSRRMNKNREDIYNQATLKGYRFVSYISSKASIFGNKIGENCFILENSIIQPFATVGNNVVLIGGSFIAHHSVVKDHVFLSAHAVLAGNCVVESNCYLGLNATIRDFTTLAEGTLVGMGANILHNTEPWGVYIGNPARKKENVMSIDAH